MRPHLNVLIAVVGCMTLTAPATGAEHPQRDIEEIVVTATKRTTPLADTPLSVAVVTRDMLETLRAVNIEDWWKLIPNLNVRDGAFGGNSAVIRGLADTDGFNVSEAISAFYIDDTAVTHVGGLYTTTASVGAMDISRVEVLRGPQGTLIGANALGGAIRVISNEPDLATRELQLDFSLSNTDEGGLNHLSRFVINQPVSERQALRVAGVYEDDGGFIDDIGLGREDVNGQKRLGLRLSWLWEAHDDFEVLARASFEDIESSGYDYADPIGRFWTNTPTTDKYQFVNYSPEPRDETIGIGSLRLRRLTDWGEIYSATSWFEKDLQLDYDWSPELFFFFGLDNSAPFKVDVRQRDISQEFRLSSNGDAGFNWLAGLYYLNQEARRQDLGVVPGLLGEVLNSKETNRRRDLALFGEIAWHLQPELELTVGGRWYRIDREIETAGFFGPTIVDRRADGDADDFVPKLSLAWTKSEDTMVYGQVAQGYRPGQFNSAPAIDSCNARVLLDSDDLTNYELGLKTALDDGRLSINVAAFHIDWRDMQVGALNLNCGFAVLDNAGRAASDGIELEFRWQPSDVLWLHGGVGYNDARLSDPNPDPAIDAPAGTRIPNVPNWTLNLASNWRFDWTSRVSGFANIRAQYIGKRSVLFDQSPGFPGLTDLDAYTIADAGLGAESGAWRFELFLDNVFNELAQLSCCRVAFDPTVARPRTVGLRATWSNR